MSPNQIYKGTGNENLNLFPQNCLVQEIVQERQSPPYSTCASISASRKVFITQNYDNGGHKRDRRIMKGESHKRCNLKYKTTRRPHIYSQTPRAHTGCKERHIDLLY